jgi:hypothetical protein
MKKEITPEGSAAPIYLEPMPKEQLQADALELSARQTELNARATQKAALLERLGMTADEALLLLS